MSEPFIGEIRLVGFNFDPRDWSYCDGQLLEIQEYPALYALIGISYGGDGVKTFALPDLRGRVPMHKSSAYIQGQYGGMETVTLNYQTMPSHSHGLYATSSNATENMPEGCAFATVQETPVYSKATPTQMMSPLATSDVGGSLEHENMQPYQTVNFIIAMKGIWPSRP